MTKFILILIIGAAFLIICIFVWQYIKESSEIEMQRRKEEKIRRDNWLTEKVENIKNDYREMRQDTRFQQVMSDLGEIIEANQEKINCIYFSYNGLSVFLQDTGDKWSLNPREEIKLDLYKYKIRFNEPAFLYWILGKYPFMTYHCHDRKDGEQYETRNLRKAIISYDKDGDRSDASRIIYRKGLDKKYWVG